MDSKLVVEQMSGRWKIKHPDMRPLADRGPAAGAGRHDVHLDPARAEQARGPARQRGAGRRRRPAGPRGAEPVGRAESQARGVGGRPQPSAAGPPGGAATTLLLVRHGVTGHTLDKRFSGGLARTTPASSTRAGRRSGPPATGSPRWPARSTPSSPRPCGARRSPRRSSPSGSARRWSLEHGLAEMEFGTWDGMTLRGDPASGTPTSSTRWLGSLDHAPGRRRVVPRAWRSGCWPASSGCSPSTPAGPSLAVSHVTPIKMLVAHALGAPLESVYRMEMAPASVTVLSFFRRRQRALRMFNARPTDARRHRLADDHVELGAVPSGGARPRRSSRGRAAGRRTGPGVPGVAAVLEQGPHDPALGGLVEVRDDLARAVDLVQHADRHHAPAGPGVGRQNGRRSTSAGRPRGRVPAARSHGARRAAGSSTSTRRRARAATRRRRAGTPGPGPRAAPARTGRDMTASQAGRPAAGRARSATPRSSASYSTPE